MVTYNTELHAKNIAALNAQNDQADIDIRLAAELQRTLDKQVLRECGINSIADDSDGDNIEMITTPELSKADADKIAAGKALWYPPMK